MSDTKVDSDTEQLEKLIASARLSGRLDMLLELRQWINREIQATQNVHERLKQEAQS